MKDEKRLALVGGTLIDGAGGDPLTDAVVLLRGSEIERVGSKDRIEVPPGYEALDVSGKTIMPGMIDCHLHPGSTTLDIKEMLFTHKTVQLFRTAEILKRTLHAGFTTIRTAGMLNDVGVRQAVEMGLIEGPRIVMAGTVAQSGGQFHQMFPRGVEVLWVDGAELADGVAGVMRATRIQLHKGYDFIKVPSSGDVTSTSSGPSTTEFTVDELKAIVVEAAARDKAVMAHAEGTRGIKNALRAGVWSVEHGSILDDEAIQMFLDSDTYLVPTLFIMQESVERGKEYNHSPTSMQKFKEIEVAFVESFRKAAAAGIKIGVGSDAIDDASHGRNACELELMVRYGFTPMQAIVAATKTSSEVCRIDDKVGTIEPGKLADLLVVDGDPLDDITILQDKSRLLLIIKEGQRYVDRLAS